MEKLTCTNCGTELSANTLFCTECGAAVASAFENGVTLPEPEQTLSEQVSPEQTPSEQTPSEPEHELLSSEPITPGFAPDFSPESDEAEIVVTKEEISASPNLPEPKTGVKPAQPLATRILIGIASVAMSLILFASVTAGQAEYIAREALSEQSISAMVEKLDINEVSFYEGESLTETIFGSIDDYYKNTFGVDEEKIGNLLQSDMVKDFVAGKAVEIAGFITGETAGNELVTADEVVGFLERNSDEIETLTGYKMVDSDIEDIKAELEKQLESATWDSVLESSPIKKSTVRLTFSIYAFVAAIALTAIFTVLLFIINRRKTAALYYCGYAFGISGLSVTVASFALNSLYSLIAEAAGIKTSSVSSLLSGVKNTVLFTGVAVMGFGVLLIVIAAVTRGIIKSKAAKA